jgi:hypothetical protein
MEVIEKLCRRCKIIKDASCFHLLSKAPDGLQPYCKGCKRLIDHIHDMKNPGRNLHNNLSNSIRNRKWVYEYLRCKKCEWEGCNISDPDMLVFDHLNPSEKRQNISAMACGTYSLRSLEQEVQKCRVLCANHHQKHTIIQFGYRNWRK